MIGRLFGRYITTAAAFLIFLLAWSACTGRLEDPDRPPAPDTVVTVVRVVDGDTIVVNGTQNIPGDELDRKPGTEVVRLIGVDTPETKHPTKPVQCYGPESSAYTKAKLPKGVTVTLRFDAGTKSLRDSTPSHRLLAYVWRTDGRMHNLELVKGGYARAAHYPPQDDWKDRFKAAEAKARAQHKGRWKACQG